MAQEPSVTNPAAGVRRLWLAVLGPVLVALAGCQLQFAQDSDWETRLYVVTAGAGQFAATAEPGVYTLTTRHVSDRVAWFADLPLRQSGNMTFAAFMAEIWPAYFTLYQPTASVGVRSADGIWSILPAQAQRATHDAAAGTLTWTLRLEGIPDFGVQTGVLVYLDDEGARGKGLAGYVDSYVFSHAAAQARFEPLADSGDHVLTLAHPLPSLLMTTVAPKYASTLVTVDDFVHCVWPAGFAMGSPNAAVSMEGPDGRMVTHTVTLSEPRWDAASDTLRFRARSLAGVPPDFAGPAILYIDSYDEREDTTIYTVVVNHEEQYSIWPAHREFPLGWRSAGFSGLKDKCLEYIEKVWTDMRPLSLRKKMEEMERERRLRGDGI